MQAGKGLFNSQNNGNTCSFCHSNAGANIADGFNRNFDTNTESLTPADRPPDGGFGDATPRRRRHRQPDVQCRVARRGRRHAALLPQQFGGDDRGRRPLLHHDDLLRPTLAVRFTLTGTQVNQIAAFLRALNALENIRSSNQLAQEAQSQLLQARQTIRERVIPDTEDAIEVLSNGPLDLYPSAVALLQEALELEEDARDTVLPRVRNALLRQAIDLKEDARDIILPPPT